MEASYPVKDGDNAKIEVKASGKPLCLGFYYHMRGSEMGSLNVFDGSFPVFAQSGNQGNAWHKVELTVFSDKVSEIIVIVRATVTGDCSSLRLACKQHKLHGAQ